jgi:hypothetical protein
MNKAEVAETAENTTKSEDNMINNMTEPESKVTGTTSAITDEAKIFELILKCNKVAMENLRNSTHPHIYSSMKCR